MHKVIYGPPGTGKTRTLITMLQEHLAIAPGHRALFCSHTKAAASTAVSRWGKESGRLDIATIHSHCFRSMGLSMSQTVDDSKVKFFVSQFGMDLDEGTDAKSYMEIIDFSANLDIPVSEGYNRSSRPGTMGHFLAFAKSYDSWKKQFGYVDFSDMLALYPTRVNKSTGHTLLAVDEAQDLTPLHWRVVEHFMKLNPKCPVIVAGDDDQCIYSYTGAVPHGAEEFAEVHQAEVKVLGQSYRVPQKVHALATEISGRILRRVPKVYHARPAEGIVQEWGDFQWGHSVGRADRDTLILYSDRFIRKEMVEPALMDRGVLYTSLSGFPAPIQTKAGQCLRIAHNGTATDEEIASIRRGLSDHGRAVWDTVGPEAVLDKLKSNDFKLLAKFHWSLEDYFRRVNWRDPVNVRISTIHGAKGMEAQDVHLVTAQSDAAATQSITDPDARHRLFYVGVTRASERLYLYGGDNSYEMPRGGNQSGVR